MTERTGVYPGTFDPVTSGHIEIVRRSLKLVDRLVIGPAINIGKGPLFSLPRSGSRSSARRSPSFRKAIGNASTWFRSRAC